MGAVRRGYGFGYGYGFAGHYQHHFDHDYHAWGPGQHYNPGMRGGGFCAGHGAWEFTAVRDSEVEALAEDSMVAAAEASTAVVGGGHGR